ncbi:MAG: flagellar biosynthesis protein FlgA, partial [Alphaproteobacteria bacterium]|nr:flagellar biosynthesis protein FlgA [Alphaproteobacteria bacterium]
YTVTGGLRPAALSVRQGYLPLGLAQNVRLKCDVAEGQAITWADAEVDQTSAAYKLRREVEEQAIPNLQVFDPGV